MLVLRKKEAQAEYWPRLTKEKTVSLPPKSSSTLKCSG